MFSASSRYEFSGSISMRSIASSKRITSIPGRRQCQGSVSLIVPSSPTTSSRSWLASARPASKCAVDSVVLAAEGLLGRDALGLAGDQPRAAHAVAPDVHQRAAVERRAEADVGGVVGDEPERGADDADFADGRLLDELGEPARLRVVAPHERLHQQAIVAFAVSKARSTSLVWRLRGFSQRTCLPASSARTVASTCIEFGSEM
jgi:hypothetical protein